MLSMVKCASLRGMETGEITVETEISRGLPTINIIGLGDATVKEAAPRIRAAITSSNLEYPNGRITINLSPAWLRKKGSHYDLAMAMGILTSSGQIHLDRFRSMAFIGELSLNGEINRCKGVMPMVKTLKDAGVKTAVVPYDCMYEAALVDGVTVYGAKTLSQLTSWLKGEKGVILDTSDDRDMLLKSADRLSSGNKDFSDIKGQEFAKRAMVIAAAGTHSVLMKGSPGTGKTMMAERLPGILPELTKEEIIELTSIYSIAGLLKDDWQIVNERPFRNPGMSMSVPALLGSGVPPRPGEATLSHKGVLFIDELGERSREIIDSLRIPMESKEIIINRMGEIYKYPADFMLVAATNPCKCGNYGDPRKECSCTFGELQSYRTRFSGPMMGRIDMHIELSSPEYGDLYTGDSMSSAEMKQMVETGRMQQKKRGIRNAHLDAKSIVEICKLTDGAEEMLRKAYDAMSMDPRSIGKVKKVARTIADLDGAEKISEKHLAEALQYRERNSR